MGLEVMPNGVVRKNSKASVVIHAPLTLDNSVSVTPGDGSVSVAKLGAAAVETAKIKDFNVTTAKLAANVLSADTEGRGKMADQFITTDKIADGNITFPKVAGGITAFRTTVVDPGNAGAIAINNSGSCRLVSATAETRTLAIPSFMGQSILIAMETDGGVITITAAQAINQAGNTHIAFGDVGDFIALVAIYISGALRWHVLASNFGSGGGGLSA